MKDAYDAVIIGSGFGGAVTACRLAQAGQSVCVLEKGGWWDRATFPRAAGEVADRMLWRPNGSAGLIEYRPFGSMSVVQGVGVGGGSLHYFNVHLPAAQEIFQDERWPRKITRRLLAPYYDLVRDMLGARLLSPPQGYDLPIRTRAFLDAAARAGATAKPNLVDVAVHTGPPHRNPHGGALQQPCEYCGNCLLGCHVHAKNTLDLNYLPVARKHGAEVFARHEVTSIVPIADEQYEVHFARGGQPDDEAEAGAVIGKTVVVAAGALGTNELLLRCRDLLETLPHVPDALGVGFSGNGCLVFSGAWDIQQRIHPGRGPTTTAAADFSTAKHHITIEDLGFPEPFLWYLEGLKVHAGGRLDELMAGLKSTLGAALRLGDGDGKLATEINRLFADSHWSNFLPFLGMGTDAANGRLRLDRNGRLELDWSPRRSMSMFWDMEQAMRRLSGAAGGTYKTGYLWKWPHRRLLTLHPLGGCAMSDNYAEGVVNAFGEVWNYPNLYIADASILPTALGVNPSATIAALAERIAFHIIHVRDLRDGDPATPKNR